LESKASALATPSYLSQSRPNLKVWTPTRLNLMAVTRQRGNAVPTRQRVAAPTFPRWHVGK